MPAKLNQETHNAISLKHVPNLPGITCIFHNSGLQIHLFSLASAGWHLLPIEVALHVSGPNYWRD